MLIDNIHNDKNVRFWNKLNRQLIDTPKGTHPLSFIADDLFSVNNPMFKMIRTNMNKCMSLLILAAQQNKKSPNTFRVHKTHVYRFTDNTG